MAIYQYRAYRIETNKEIVRLVKEGAGIRSISRLLHISVTTVIKRIRAIATTVRSRIHPPLVNGIYEIDELWTYIGKKDNETWITYSFNRLSSQVIDFVVGPRTKEQLSRITNATLAMAPSKVCTDGLATYRSLVPPDLHRVGLPHTRRIERFNLNLRTHLKRLGRKTICFSRNQQMLESCLRIYFWAT